MIPWLSREFWRSWDRWSRPGRDAHRITYSLPGIPGVAILKAPPANLKQFRAAFDRARDAAGRRAVTLRFVRQHAAPSTIAWREHYADRLAAAPVALQDRVAGHLYDIAVDLIARPNREDT